jgi:hypothetical protein
MVFKIPLCQAPVAHAYDPSYSGGRDQEGHSLKLAWANSLQDAISKETHHNKRAVGVAQRCVTWFQAPVLQKKKKNHPPLLFIYPLPL